VVEVLRLKKFFLLRLLFVIDCSSSACFIITFGSINSFNNDIILNVELRAFVFDTVVPGYLLERFFAFLELLCAVEVSRRLNDEEAEDSSYQVKEARKPQEVFSVLADCNEVDGPDDLHRSLSNHQASADH
jgi:hypothetical protein